MKIHSKIGSRPGKPTYRTPSPFRQKVLSVVKNIPSGKVLTYKQVAERAGRPRAFRAVGSILKGNFDASVPCHRVIRSDGKLGEYNRGAKKKKELLEKEGALVMGKGGRL
ncbi:MAG TPA: MGMT family protein [Candidatus Moranbacteria bacterium]|nr:MGMT family protein [Candidatus Moranbacteria bacterium]